MTETPKTKCQHEPIEVFNPRSGRSEFSDDCDALFSFSRNDAEGSSLKIRVCKHCGHVYADIENWPDPEAERKALEEENARLREELEALRSGGGSDEDPDENSEPGESEDLGPEGP